MMHEEFRSSGLDISHANITNNMRNEAAHNSSLFQVDQTATFPPGMLSKNTYSLTAASRLNNLRCIEQRNAKAS